MPRHSGQQALGQNSSRLTANHVHHRRFSHNLLGCSRLMLVLLLLLLLVLVLVLRLPSMAFLHGSLAPEKWKKPVIPGGNKAVFYNKYK